MSIRCILILESINDLSTRKKIITLSESPLLTRYTIGHCYAVELTEDEKRLPTSELLIEAMTKFIITKTALFNKIEKRIQSFKPDLLLVHAGFIFHRNQDIFFRVITELKSKYPDIKFGLERISGVKLDIPVFDDDEEVMDLTNLIFCRVLGM